MRLTSVDKSDALKFISKQIHCPVVGEGQRLSIVSESLREVIYFYMLNMQDEEHFASVATLRLTGTVRQKLGVLWTDLDSKVMHKRTDTSQTVLDTLESLNKLGDLHRTSGGMWCIPPIHAIECGEGCSVLLGGGPISALPTDIASKTKVVGRSRLLTSDKKEKLVDIWTVSEWLGGRTEGLDDWANNLLKLSILKMTDNMNDLGQVQVYVESRWQELAELPSEVKGFYICRMRVKGYFSYFFGHIKSSVIIRLSSLSAQDARRYRFYLDAHLNNPVQVKAHYTSQGLIRLQLIRPLPEEEKKLLSLGWKVPPEKGEYRKADYFEFPIEVVPLIREVLDRLKIVLVLVQG